ncbi:putative ABC transporter permease protein [Carnimonas sp. R-84981]|uniref:FecCD family ABC transporter permease n=1 Tax=Carnimonas bestiolae TaxID=3402172 RepID=UPI003EDC2BEA
MRGFKIMRRYCVVVVALLLALFVMSAVALCVGRYSVDGQQLMQLLIAPFGASSESDPVVSAVVLQSRLPRIVAAILIGAALSCAGASYQAVFRNPLVSPDLLGVLSGAACGAAVMIIAGLNPLLVQAGAFTGGLIAVAAGMSIARVFKVQGLLSLLMGGLIANAVFTASLSLLKYLADPLDQLPAIVDWLLGSLAQANWSMLAWISVPMLALLAIMLRLAPLLDILSLPDEEAQSLGIAVKRQRLLLIGIATLASAMTISMAGIIGWVGLLIPHVARLLVGASHRHMMPVCAVAGALCMVLSDTLARSLSISEIPLGVITELTGALAFILVLYRVGRTLNGGKG